MKNCNPVFYGVGKEDEEQNKIHMEKRDEYLKREIRTVFYLYSERFA
jgi:hypothetical protein